MGFLDMVVVIQVSKNEWNQVSGRTHITCSSSLCLRYPVTPQMAQMPLNQALGRLLCLELHRSAGFGKS